MLISARRAAPKPAKRRSRAGCVHCKDKKKKCTEERPACQRCVERGLECHYEPIQPRRRRRTASPAGSPHLAQQANSTSASPSIGFTPRIESLRHNSTSTSPTLAPPGASSLLGAGGTWETQSAYDSGSQYNSDFASEGSMSPNLLEGSPRSFSRHSSVPVESMNTLYGFPEHRSRSHLDPHFSQLSQSVTPEIMTVPFRRPSDYGSPEVVSTIPIMPSQHIEQTEMITSAPVAMDSSYDPASHSLLPQGSAYFPAHGSNPDIIDSFHPIHSQGLDSSNFIRSITTPPQSGSIYSPDATFVQPSEMSPPLSSASSHHHSVTANAFTSTHTPSDQNTNDMAWWPPMDEMDSNYYVPDQSQ